VIQTSPQSLYLIAPIDFSAACMTLFPACAFSGHCSNSVSFQIA